MPLHLRWLVAGAAAALLGLGGCSDGHRRADELWLRGLFAQLPTFPGATLADDRVYEVQSGSGGTGRYGVRQVYRLPPEVTTAQVLGFLRDHLPEGWREATDETCAETVAGTGSLPMLPGSEDTIPRSDVVLVWRRSQLTVFPPGGGRVPVGQHGGMTFTLSRHGDVKRLELGPVSMSCGVEQVDQRAIDFDAPPGTAPEGPRPTVPAVLG